jgi:signal transduction histidine kinase
MQPLAESRNQSLRLTTSRPVEIVADATRMRQLIDNLVDNAVKYTHEGGEIGVAVSGVGSFAELTVRDNGPGIPAEHLPRVFERFYRVDKSRSRSLGGAGLGLSIVQSVVHAHHGTVRASCGPMGGTCFTVLLPAAPETDATSSEQLLSGTAGGVTVR